MSLCTRLACSFTVTVRGAKEQLAALVNAHIGAVVPGMSVSINRLLSQLERDPGEFIVDPWVAERTTLVVDISSVPSRT